MTAKPLPNVARRRCAVYLRISKDVRDGAGVGRQESECRDLAGRLGWDVVVVYSDNDREASSGKPRPAYEQMLDDMRNDRIDAVIGWHSDRIYRRPDELEDLIKLADAHDVQFAAVVVGRIDLSTASGRLIARLLGATAKYETELKGERQRAQLKQRALAGLPTGGGTRPFGYERGWMSLRADEAEVIRDLVRRLLAGESINSLTDWLIANDVPTVSGKPWHPTVVRNTLMRPAIAGLSTWEGEIVGRGQWPAIITEDEHRRVVATIASRNRRKGRAPRVAILPGLIWCGRCGYELVTFNQARPPERTDSKDKWVFVRSYGCRTHALAGRPGYKKSCGKVSIKAEWVEDDVVERIFARLSRPANARQLAEVQGDGPDVSAQTAELADLDERLRQLGVDYADGIFGRTEFIAARDRITERVRELESAVSGPRLEVPLGDAAALVAWWEKAPLGTRQALVRQYVDRVTVMPHQGRRSHFDPGRVIIDWK